MASDLWPKLSDRLKTYLILVDDDGIAEATHEAIAAAIADYRAEEMT